MEYENTKPTILTKNPKKKIVNSVKNNTVSGKKISNDEELPKLTFVGKETGLKIQKARTLKKKTQKDIAKQLNMDLALYQKYENGTAQRNGQKLNTIGKLLGVKLTGKGV